MRRHLAVVLFLVAAAGLAFGSQAASASPVTIAPFATGPNSHAVTVIYNSDETPITASISAPTSGTAATAASLAVSACFSITVGNCIGFIGDADGSAAGFNSGSLIALDPDGFGSPLTLTFTVGLSCGAASSAVFTTTQDGTSLSTSLFCGGASLIPATLGYAGCPFFSGFGFPLADTLACPHPKFQGMLPGQSVTAVGHVLVPTPLLRGNRAGAAAVVSQGAGATARNLARHYAQAAAVAAAQAAITAQQLAFQPPSTGEAGLIELCDAGMVHADLCGPDPAEE